MNSIRRFLFDLRMKTWPVRVWLMNLSWLPLWWLKKTIPRNQLTWTPAATIRALSKRVEYLEAKNEHFLREWHKTEEALRVEKMARVSDGLSSEQKEWTAHVMGVRFHGSEVN